MGLIKPDDAPIAIRAYKNILNTFTAITNVHGFLYYLIFLSALMNMLYALPVELERKDKLEVYLQYSSKNIRRSAITENAEFLIALSRLRNYVVHFNPVMIPELVRDVTQGYKMFNINAVKDRDLQRYIDILMSADWEYMKSEIHRLCPDITF